MRHGLSLTLLHGWGIDARIWQPLAPHWPEGMRVTAPNWPGYDDQPALADPADIAATANAMAASLSRDSVWVGWSLGGLLAVAMAEHLPPPRGIILLGAGARFCALGGVTPDALAEFSRAFERSPAAAWRHFLRWQSSGEPEPREALKRLTELLGQTPPADTATLAAGLGFLEALDHRDRLAALPCPVAALAGERDPLLPATGGERLPGVGHCPMVSRPAPLADALCRIAADMTSPAEAP
ncbi:alpha/beta fold hydrolase [Halomonas piscis]|uniref:Alpha/beta fold hydrolase n=1 Tax=Halomonas piscis TaxID=3031727 RepID=A0ABY9Z3H3_9GAMM|nr:alpha/beta fold hydrolase [Halomonas piscis]WNK20824.1 alpha/beta fold hydrolase [Halomonas piscis]